MGRFIDHQSAKRLKQELALLSANPLPLVSAGLKGNDLYEWTAILLGPPDSPYEGGTFVLSLKFTARYPFEPPMVNFVTRIFHCNVSESGGICLDILQDKWTPALQVSSLLLSIQSLMTDANPNSPLRADIAYLYKNKRDEHDIKAMEWTVKYAMSGPN